MTAPIYFRPIVPLVLALVAGIFLGTCFPGQTVLTACVTCVATGIVIWGLKQKQTMFIVPIILFAALGYLSIQSWIAPDLPSHHIIHYADNRARKIIGIVDTSPIESNHRKKFVFRATSIRRGNRYIPVSGCIRVTVVGTSARFDKGDMVAVISKIRLIKNFNNPGGFDYKRYMLFKRVMASAYVSPKHFSVVEKGSEATCLDIVVGAREKICHLIEATQHGDPQDVLKALIIGDRNAISTKLQQSFNRAGVAHLLAISGLHVGIVAAVSFILFQKLLSHIKILLWHAWVKKGAVIISLVPIWVYGLLSGMSPATQRAVIMVTVFLLTFLFESEHDHLNTLAIAALVILVVHPPALFSISFQLSFSAVFGIVYGMVKIGQPWASRLGKTNKTIGAIIFKKLCYFFLASLFATLGTLPLLMRYFNQVSLVGLFANVIIVPLIGFIVVPIGLFSVFICPLTMTGASYCLKVCSWVLEPTLYMVMFFADLPFSAVKTVTPTMIEICCFYVLFGAMLNWSHRATVSPTERAKMEKSHQCLQKNRHRNSLRVMLQRPAIIAAVLAILVLSADICYWFYHRFWHNDLKISVIDVGHGSAFLLELPKGYTILMDGGGFTDNSIFDVGARIVAPFLWRRKIKTIDTIILSHPNSDHLNGLIYVADNFRVKSVWTNNQGSENVGYKEFLRVIKKNKIFMPAYEKIYGRHCLNGVNLDVFYPPVDFIDRQKNDGWRDVNNNSLVVKVTLGLQSILFPGDIKAKAEEALVATAGDKIASTVLMAPHHGSKTSSSPPFIDQVNPEVVVISSGREGWFGLPHPSIVKRYRKKGCQIFVTSRHGAITLSTDGKRLCVKTTVTSAD